MPDGPHFSTYVYAEAGNDLVQKAAQATERADIIILTGSRHRKLREMYSDARAWRTEALVVFNPSYTVELYSLSQLRAVIKRCHWMFLNKSEADDISRRVADPRSFACETRRVVITSRRGAILIDGTKHPPLPSVLKGRVRRHVGAGDALLSATVNYDGLSVRSAFSALKFGLAAAARFVEGHELDRKSLLRRARLDEP